MRMVSLRVIKGAASGRKKGIPQSPPEMEARREKMERQATSVTSNMVKH